MKILGLDAAPTKTGVCYLVDGHLETALLTTKTMDGERLAFYFRWLKEELRKKVDLVVMEGISYGQFTQSQMELGGVIKLACHQVDVQIVLVTPSTLKLWATNNGKHPGKLVHEARTQLGLDLSDKQDDEADAAFLAQIGYMLRTGQDGDCEHHRYVLAGLRGNPIKRVAPPKKKAA